MHNFPITDPTYQPAMRVISSITNANPAVVTTTTNHDYTNGLIVRLVIPAGFGMTQANQLIGTITVTGNTTFTIDIDTSNFDVFAAPTNFPFDRQVAKVVPIGEVSNNFNNVTRNVL